MSALSRLLSALLLGALFATTSACAATPPPPTEPRYSPAQLREDFDALYAGLQAAHYDLYAHRTKREYDALYRRMRDALDAPLTATETRLRFQRFAAFGRVAHARVELPMAAWESFRGAGGKAFPLFLRFVDGHVYVKDDISGSDAVAPGDELLSVAGQPVRTWLAPVRELVSADNDRLSDAQLETRLPVLVWLAHGEHATFDVVVRKAGGDRVEATLAARDRAGYTAAMAAQPARFELDWNDRSARMLENGIAYLRPGPFYDNRPEAATPWDTSAFKRFIDDAFADFAGKDARILVIDLRDNPGGDNSFSDHLLSWIADRPFRFSDHFDIRISEQTTTANRRRLQSLGGDTDSMSAKFDALYAGKTIGSHVEFPMPFAQPRAAGRFGGRVYVLINRHSYSNAVSAAAIVQDYRFGRIVGEETSDLASTYGAMETFTLAHTGIEVGYPKARILRPSGDPSPTGVIPDIAIATPIVPVGEDLVLEQAIAAIAADAPEQQ